ncbi:hypothetical protein A6456_09340 [Paraburkholderia tropica]|nr:hypothetical protein A6456_09340 [Paraburkholderia tropica]
MDIAVQPRSPCGVQLGLVFFHGGGVYIERTVRVSRQDLIQLSRLHKLPCMDATDEEKFRNFG